MIEINLTKKKNTSKQQQRLIICNICYFGGVSLFWNDQSNLAMFLYRKKKFGSLFRYFLPTYAKYSVIVILEVKILEANFLLPKTISDACFYALHIHVKINSALQFYLTICILVILNIKAMYWD